MQIESLMKSWSFRQFKPAPFCANPHLMTILPGFIPRSLKLPDWEARHITVDRDIHILVKCHWQQDKVNSPTVILLHGLEGSSERHYMQGITWKAYGHGFNVIRMNMRCCGPLPDDCPTLYHAGLTQDLSVVIENLVAKDAINQIYVVGYSLGGNIVLNLLSQLTGNTSAIKGACAVCPAVDLTAAVQAMEHPKNALYQTFFLMGLKAKIAKKASQFPHIFSSTELAKIKTIRQFDNQYTAPWAGFGTAENYYSQASSIKNLSNIKLPTLILAAKDDPLVPAHLFHQKEFDNPALRVILSEYGGHGGFYQQYKEDIPLFDKFWAENRVVDFLSFLHRSSGKPANTSDIFAG